MDVLVTCSFCDKPASEARCIVQGPPQHNICDACILICMDIMVGQNRPRAAQKFAATPINEVAVDRRAERFLLDRVAEMRASIPMHVVDAEITAWCHRFIDELDRAVRAEARRGAVSIGDAYSGVLGLFEGDSGIHYRIALLSFADGTRPNRGTFNAQARSLARGYGTWRQP